MIPATDEEALTLLTESAAQNQAAKFYTSLGSMPAPGEGCHTALLSVANLGAKAGLDPDTVAEEIQNHIPPGSRDVPEREVWAAVDKAFNSKSKSRDRGVPRVNPDYLAIVTARGRNTTEQKLSTLSRFAIPSDATEQGLMCLRHLFKPTDYIFAGTTFTRSVIEAKKLFHEIESTGVVDVPHICPNTFTGAKHESKSGKPSYRCDAAVLEYRYAVAEFDTIPKDEQIAFWSAIPLPIAALVDSGGKSIHAWINVTGVDDAAGWTDVVRTNLYDGYLIPLGVDRACANPARLSRMPGHYRKEKRSLQRLLYLNPNPKPGSIIDQ